MVYYRGLGLKLSQSKNAKSRYLALKYFEHSNWSFVLALRKSTQIYVNNGKVNEKFM